MNPQTSLARCRKVCSEDKVKFLRHRSFGSSLLVKNSTRPSRWCVFLLLAFTALLLACTVLVILFYLGIFEKEAVEYHYEPPESSAPLGIYEKFAVSTDAGPCAGIPRKIFKRNGSIADAAVATLLCSGVVNPHSMGIGGGFIATIYKREKGKAYVINARERAPKAATKDMFVDDPESSNDGGKAAGVPGELLGYEILLKHFGSHIPWKDLFEDAIFLAEKGFPVSEHLANAMRVRREKIRTQQTLRSVFWNEDTDDVYEAGDMIKNPTLATTLRKLADGNVQLFYSGQLGEDFIKDVQDYGGIMTMDDLRRYSPVIEEPLLAELGDGNKLFSPQPPGSGVILSFILRVMNKYLSSSDPIGDPILLFHRLIETFKFAYALRSELGDPVEEPSVTELVRNMTDENFIKDIHSKIKDSGVYDDLKDYGFRLEIKEDHGTAHSSFIAPNGDALSVTSTINAYFGANRISHRTGIILNDEMDDFSSPNITNSYGVEPSPTNFIKPDKRPLSSMSPAVMINKNGDATLVIGGNGGPKITTGIAWVIIRQLFYNDTIKQAIDYPRLHHQLLPLEVQYEKEFPQVYLRRLETFGHKVKQIVGRSSVILGIARGADDKLYTCYDYRKGGGIDGE